MPSTFTSLRPYVKVDGAKVSEQKHQALRSLRVVHGIGTPAYARLAFSVSPELDSIGIAMGAELKIGVDGLKSESDSDVVWDLFDGLVVSVGLELDTGSAQTVIVEAYDKLYKLGRKTVVKSYVDKTPSDVVKELAGAAGLAHEIDSSFGTAVRKFAYQHATAYAYIDQLVRDEGCEWLVAGGKLKVRPRGSANAGTLTLTAGENLLEFSSRYSATDHVDTVTVTGWDAKTKARIVGTATSSGGLAVSSITKTSVSAVNGAGVGGVSAMSLPRPVADRADADRVAKGIVQRRESDMLRARGRAIPSEKIVPGASLTLAKLADGWNGTYYCTEVEHVWGASSFDTYFEVGSSEPDSLVDLFDGSVGNTIEGVLTGLTVGIVTNNTDDPDGMNRVKVKLPYLADDQETGWARVLQPGAGNARGWAVHPEVNDEVLVGFEHGNIDRPYVLGGLYNGTDKPKYPANGTLVDSGEVVARTFTSRLGHEIYVADGSSLDKQYVKIVTKGVKATLFLGEEKIDLQADGIPVKVFNDQGSIEIAKNGAITLESKNNVTIKTSTGDVTIEAKNINLKATTNVAIDAKAKLDLTSMAPATLESKAITAIKGTMVQIN